MKILVATKNLQGQRKNDFCFVPEGEMVSYSTECDGEDIDGTCGCRRSMSGLKCRKSTTTVMVADIPDKRLPGPQSYAEAIRKSECKAGFTRNIKEASSIASQLLKEAAKWPVGTVLEKRGEKFAVRSGGVTSKPSSVKGPSAKTHLVVKSIVDTMLLEE